MERMATQLDDHTLIMVKQENVLNLGGCDAGMDVTS